MEQLVELLQEPIAAAVVAALVLVLAMIAFTSFGKARKEREDRERSLRREQDLRRQFDAIMDSSRDGIIITTTGGEVALVSGAAARILGIRPDDAVGRSVARLPIRAVDEKMRSVLIQEAFAPAEEGEAPRVIGVPGRRGVDDVRWLHIHSRVVDDAFEGKPVVVVTIMDTTGMREAAEALHRSDAQFRKAMENAPVGMALVDLEWRLMEVNRAFAEMMGSTVAALRGTPFGTLSHPQDLQAERDQLQRLYDGHQNRFSLEKRYVRADGNVVWAVLDVALVRHAGGAPDHYVVHVRDSTDDRMHSELLAHRAMHDPLTGLANRTLLQDVLQQVLEQPDAQGRVGVLAIDLDGFKGLNDRFGHATGDNALVHVAGILRSAVAGRGTVARLGGDEFVIAISAEDCESVVAEIAEAIHEGLRRPFQVKRHHVILHASIGVAIADEDAVDAGAQSLLSAADVAMYRAKAHGRGRTEVFEPSMRSTDDSRAVLAGEFHRAITNGDLVLHYQPVLELATRTVVGYEALVGW